MKTFLLQACVLLAAGFIFAQDQQDKPAGATQGTYEVRLVDGTILVVKSHRFGSNFVILSLGDGSTAAFRREDIELETLPSKPERPAESDTRAGSSKNSDGVHRPDSLGDRQLHEIAAGTHLSDNKIFIVGDGTLKDVSTSPSFEEQRQVAFPQSADVPAPGLVVKDADGVAGLTCKGYEQSLAGPSPIYTNMQCQVIAKAFVKYGKIRPPKDDEVGPGTIIVSIRISEFGHSISSDVQILRLGPNAYLPPAVIDSFSIPGVTGSNGEDVIRLWVRMWETIDKKYLR